MQSLICLAIRSTINTKPAHMFVPLDVQGYQYNLRALKEIYEKKTYGW